jgi:hypothetical protein
MMAVIRGFDHPTSAWSRGAGKAENVHGGQIEPYSKLSLVEEVDEIKQNRSF